MVAILQQTGRSFTFIQGDHSKKPKPGFVNLFAARLFRTTKSKDIHKSSMNLDQNSMHLSKALNKMPPV